jgi:hypothetical protein
VLKGALAVGSVEVVDVGVAERATRHSVTADSDTASSDEVAHALNQDFTHEATGPIMLKISKSMASVTELSSSPT